MCVWSQAAKINLFSADREIGKDLNLSLYMLHLQVSDASFVVIIKSTAFKVLNYYRFSGVTFYTRVLENLL